MVRSMVFAGLIAGFASGWSFGAEAPRGGSDPGYFLTFSQKGQLIWRGRMQDPQTEDWYDVWICPGYVAPSREAAESWLDSVDAFAEYGGKKKYQDLADDSGDALEWGYEDSFWEFGFEGTGKAWKKHFQKANARAEKRVFGWWMAHPWAFLQSTTETVFRIPLGTAGAALGTVWGIGVVPVWHLTNSAIEGTAEALCEGVALPVVAYAWNTVSSPVLAMVGQRPSADRVDGFWVRRLSAEEHQLSEIQAQTMGPRERKEIQAVAVLLHKTIRGDIAQIAATQKELNDRIAALRQEYNEKLRDLRQRRDIRMREALGTSPDSNRGIHAPRTARERIRSLRPAIEQALVEAGATEKEKREIYSLMHQHAGDLLLRVRPKTDPVRTTLKTLGDID